MAELLPEDRKAGPGPGVCPLGTLRKRIGTDTHTYMCVYIYVCICICTHVDIDCFLQQGCPFLRPFKKEQTGRCRTKEKELLLGYRVFGISPFSFKRIEKDKVGQRP